MSLDLDERQHAMLAEMGVRLFQRPTVAPEAIPASARAVPVPAAPSVVPVRQVAPAAVPVTAASLAAVVRERPAGTATMDWPALRDAVAGCQACKLCSSRRNPVFGVGDERADWLIVGEPPDEDEDLQGEPFVGQAGKLLDNMLKALQLDRRNKVFVTNVLKCRPPGNRNPEPEEVAQCEHVTCGARSSCCSPKSSWPWAVLQCSRCCRRPSPSASCVGGRTPTRASRWW
jgi:hypothetical protein